MRFSYELPEAATFLGSFCKVEDLRRGTITHFPSRLHDTFLSPEGVTKNFRGFRHVVTSRMTRWYIHGMINLSAVLGVEDIRDVRYGLPA